MYSQLPAVLSFKACKLFYSTEMLIIYTPGILLKFYTQSDVFRSHSDDTIQQQQAISCESG